MTLRYVLTLVLLLQPAFGLGAAMASCGTEDAAAMLAEASECCCCGSMEVEPSPMTACGCGGESSPAPEPATPPVERMGDGLLALLAHPPATTVDSIRDGSARVELARTTLPSRPGDVHARLCVWRT